MATRYCCLGSLTWFRVIDCCYFCTAPAFVSPSWEVGREMEHKSTKESLSGQFPCPWRGVLGLASGEAMRWTPAAYSTCDRASDRKVLTVLAAALVHCSPPRPVSQALQACLTRRSVRPHSLSLRYSQPSLRGRTCKPTPVRREKVRNVQEIWDGRPGEGMGCPSTM